jgi:hypothetical protein
MTFHWTDPDGDRLTVTPNTHPDRPPVLSFRVDSKLGVVDVPLDRLAEVLEGIRDTARQATGGQP